MKNSATVSNEKLDRLREVKREASRRCRARAKAIANGELLTSDLLLRSLQPKAKKFDNFKFELPNKTVRLNRNGGSAVALIVTERIDDTVIKRRKSFKSFEDAVKAFNIVTKA